MPIPSTVHADYLVRVDACGLCRSDLHAAASWSRDWDELGHEFGGTITAVGKCNARFSIGDRVAVRNAAVCGECERCRSRDRRGCSRLVVNTQGFRSVAMCDERSLVRADGLDDEALALVEPTNVALDLLHAAAIPRGERVAILGSGTLGLLSAFLLRDVWGVRDVVVVGRRQHSPLATAIGLTRYASSESSAVDNVVRTQLAGGAPGWVLVTTPPSTLGLALELCRPRGYVLTVGLDNGPACVAPIDARRLIFKQLTLRGVCAAPNLYFEQAVAVLRTHGAVLRRLVTHHAEYDDLETTLRAWDRRAHFDGKTIVVKNGGPSSCRGRAAVTADAAPV